MSQDLLIRAADKKDLASLLELYRYLIPSDPPLADANAECILERFSRYEGSAIFVGVVNGALVSTCTLVVVPNLTRSGASYALIENVVTHPQHRRRGYGQAILKGAIAAAWESGCYKIMLLTGSKDPATLGFYQSIGFERSKTGFETRRLPAREPWVDGVRVPR
jgi:GNAT superfamily N-acetyltransferase